MSKSEGGSQWSSFWVRRCLNKSNCCQPSKSLRTIAGLHAKEEGDHYPFKAVILVCAKAFPKMTAIHLSRFKVDWNRISIYPKNPPLPRKGHSSDMRTIAQSISQS